MSKQFWKGSALLAPVPAALVSCGTPEKPNVLTIAWTGIVCTHPPITYISVRPERYSYGLIKNSDEFVINLTTSAMCKEVDFCGVRSGRDIDKLEKCGFHGGGFAGTIQAFVPNYLAADYADEMNRVFGENSCYVLTVRPVGGCEITIYEKTVG